MRSVRTALLLAALIVAVPLAGVGGHSAGKYCAGPQEREFLRLINDFRSANGVSKLDLSQTLGAAAEHHSKDMAKRDYFSHKSKGSKDTPKDRLLDHDYPANQTSWGENIYAGHGTKNGVDQGSAKAAFDWWKNSPGHRANMLDPKFNAIGIDRSSKSNSKYKHYWTTDFGGTRDRDAKSC